MLIDVKPALDSFSSLHETCHTMPHTRLVFHATNFVPLPLMLTKTSQNDHNHSSNAWENDVDSKLLPSTKTLNIQDDKNDNNNDDNVLSEEEEMDLVKTFNGSNAMLLTYV